MATPQYLTKVELASQYWTRKNLSVEMKKTLIKLNFEFEPFLFMGLYRQVIVNVTTLKSL
jgi:hypothetical protein